MGGNGHSFGDGFHVPGRLKKREFCDVSKLRFIFEIVAPLSLKLMSRKNRPN